MRRNHLKPGTVVLERTARSVGTKVYLEFEGYDHPDGPWMTVCEFHGGCVHHQTRELAEQWLSHPEVWCNECQEAANDTSFVRIFFTLLSYAQEVALHLPRTVREMTEHLHDRIIRTLTKAGFEAYYVGGAVRDGLLKRPVKDIDIATAATPEQVLYLFPGSAAIGRHFGVVLVKGGEEAVEVATFRLDGAYKNGRHPVSVSYTTDIREDVKRRDFTINALVRDREGKVHDFVDGLKDLDDRLIRTVGEPNERFQEDYLRMLRAVRFACQLRFRIEPKTFQAIQRNAHQIVRISAERIREELNRILRSGKAAYGFRLLHSTGLLNRILPEIELLRQCPQDPLYHPEGDVLTHTLGLLVRLPEGSSITLALAALLHDVGKPATIAYKHGQPTFHGHEEAGARIAETVLTRLRYPVEVIELVRSHIAQHMRFRVAQEMRRGKLYRFIRQAHFSELLELHRLDAQAGSGKLENAEFIERVLQEVPPEEYKPEHLLSGHDLITLGLTPGPQFATILESLETEQLEGRVTNRDHALEFVQSRLNAGVWCETGESRDQRAVRS